MSYLPTVKLPMFLCSSFLGAGAVASGLATASAFLLGDSSVGVSVSASAFSLVGLVVVIAT